MSGGEEVIQSVLGTRCYYARLGVSRSADEDEIRKAYKKRAMKLHPDRNKHPRAEEAFKLVGTAHTVLVDPAKRREYDQVGEEGMNGGGGHAFQRGFNRRGQAVHPEDIFDIFDILRGAHVQRQQQRQRHHAPQGPPPNQALLNFINMFPLIIMLGVYLLSGMGIGGHDSLPFSLDRNIERMRCELIVYNKKREKTSQALSHKHKHKQAASSLKERPTRAAFPTTSNPPSSGSTGRGERLSEKYGFSRILLLFYSRQPLLQPPPLSLPFPHRSIGLSQRRTKVTSSRSATPSGTTGRLGWRRHGATQTAKPCSRRYAHQKKKLARPLTLTPTPLTGSEHEDPFVHGVPATLREHTYSAALGSRITPYSSYLPPLLSHKSPFQA